MFGILMDDQVVSIADSGKAVVTEMITVLVGGSAYLAVVDDRPSGGTLAFGDVC